MAPQVNVQLPVPATERPPPRFGESVYVPSPVVVWFVTRKTMIGFVDPGGVTSRLELMLFGSPVRMIAVMGDDRVVRNGDGDGVAVVVAVTRREDLAGGRCHRAGDGHRPGGL